MGFGRRAGARIGIAALATCLGTAPAHGFYLGDNQDFELRARFYTEVAIAAEESEPQTMPARSPFQVIEHRTFVNPELDAKLTRYQPFGLDELKFRLALWGFYDGIYDYLTSQYDRATHSIKGRISEGHTETAAKTRTDTLVDPRKVYTYQFDPVLGGYGEVPFRINEAYLSATKGPLFVRVGRQTISWGESDTVALLDANNPFNQTLAIPGVFQDIDEARIPLWTLRATYDLFQRWGPFASAYAESYLVPGSIDTTISPLPLPLMSPYSPPQDDPQSLIAGLIPPDIGSTLVKPLLGGIQLALYNKLPTRSMSNSRFGFRLGGIVNTDYTVSAWYYRTFANPVPVFQPLDLSRSPLRKQQTGRGSGKGPTQLITEIHNGLVDVFGIAGSWFSPRLNGVIRTEAEFFLGEPAFIPSQNVPFQRLLRTPRLRGVLAAIGQPIPKGDIEGNVPHADFIRFELGYDRFFFFRPLNPSNSFTWVTAYVAQWNLSETFSGKDYRFNGQLKPSSTGLRTPANTKDLTLQTISKLHTVPSDFVDLYPYESFFQTHLETTYMHGRLTPQLTAIIGLDGTWALPVGLTYRHSDNLLFDLRYVALGGAFTWPTGFFRDRSQLSARMTVLLN